MPIKEDADQSGVTIQTMLGFQISNNLKLIEKIEKGLSYGSFVRLSKNMGIPLDALRSAVGIAPRTFTRRKDEKKFSREESDRIVSLSRLFAQTIELFEGDKEAAQSWLNNPNHAFGGRTPLDIAATETGTREVENLIGRLEHGVFT